MRTCGQREASMRQRAVQLLVATSFALSLAVHVLWLRSYSNSERVNWQGSGGWRSIRTAAGHLEFNLLLVDWSGRPASQFHGPEYERDVVQRPFNGLLELCGSVGDV